MNVYIEILLGIILADFISGLIHWIQDRYAKPSWPIVGRAIAAAHEHHTNALKMLQGGFWKRNDATMVLVGIIGMLVALFGGLNIMTVTALIIGALANEIHATTHRRGVSWWIGILRFTGLIQSPAHHARHHRPRAPVRLIALSPHGLIQP